MACKHCEAARNALLNAKIKEAMGHTIKAVVAKVESIAPKKSRRSRTTPPQEGNTNAQE
jgi:hypothetical protein